MFSKFEGYRPAFLPSKSTKYELLQSFAKTISFLFYIFEIYVQLFLRNTFKFFQILLIEWIFYKKTDEWYIEWQRVPTASDKNDNEWCNEWPQVATSDNESQWVTTNDNKWQWVTAKKRSYSEIITAKKWLFLKNQLLKKAAVLKKQLLWESYCCVEVVTLKNCEEEASPKTRLSWKSRNLCEKGNRYLKKIPN